MAPQGIGLAKAAGNRWGQVELNSYAVYKYVNTNKRNKNNGNRKQQGKGEHEPTDPSPGRHHLELDRRDHVLQRQFVQLSSATMAYKDNSSNS